MKYLLFFAVMECQHPEGHDEGLIPPLKSLKGFFLDYIYMTPDYTPNSPISEYHIVFHQARDGLILH